MLAFNSGIWGILQELLLSTTLGRTITSREQYTHDIGADRTAFSSVFEEGGILEISCSTDVAIRAAWETASDSGKLLEPGSKTARAWTLGGEGNRSLVFKLSGDGGEDDGGSFRAKLRPLGEGNNEVKYEVLAEGGKVILTGSRQLRSVPSNFDVLVTRDGEIAANEPEELILTLPPNASAVRFSTGGMVLLDGFTRPTGLPYYTSVPQDYHRAQPELGRLPVWFGLRPEGAEDRIRDHLTTLIKVQQRPPEDDADILAGRYQWEDLLPSKGGRGRHLLCSRDPRAKSRLEALPSLFAAVPTGVETEIDLSVADMIGTPQRRLAYFRGSSEPVFVEIFVDGVSVFRRKIVSHNGEVRLPQIASRKQRILIECEDPSFEGYISHVLPDRATNLKRYVLRIDPGESLEFLCNKTTDEDELVSGRFFSRFPSESDALLRVNIQPGEGGGFRTVSESYTVRERFFTIEPDLSETTSVLGGKSEQLDAGQRFYIPFGRDMKPGQYKIAVSCDSAVGGYLTLFKVTGGAFSDVRFYKGGEK